MAPRRGPAAHAWSLGVVGFLGIDLVSAQQLYKYLPSKFVHSFVREGKILFRNLTYFRQYEDAARGDETEGVHVDSPGNNVTITNLSTGQIIKGDFRFLNSIEQDRIFVFCLSRSFDDKLFDEFQADACIVICDLETFFQRCDRAARRLVKIESPGLIHRQVEYYKLNEASDLSVKDPRSLSFFKHTCFAYQDEYRAIFAHRGGFKLLQRIVNNQFTFQDEIKEGNPHSRLLRVGNLERIVKVRYRERGTFKVTAQHL